MNLSNPKYTATRTHWKPASSWGRGGACYRQRICSFSLTIERQWERAELRRRRDAAMAARKGGGRRKYGACTALTEALGRLRWRPLVQSTRHVAHQTKKKSLTNRLVLTTPPTMTTTTPPPPSMTSRFKFPSSVDRTRFFVRMIAHFAWTHLPVARIPVTTFANSDLVRSFFFFVIHFLSWRHSGNASLRFRFRPSLCFSFISVWIYFTTYFQLSLSRSPVARYLYFNLFVIWIKFTTIVFYVRSFPCFHLFYEIIRVFPTRSPVANHQCFFTLYKI